MPSGYAEVFRTASPRRWTRQATACARISCALTSSRYPGAWPPDTGSNSAAFLAYSQSGPFNAAALAESLGLPGQATGRHPGLFVDLMLVRRLAPWQDNQGKRLVKSPKVYVRDGGWFMPCSAFEVLTICSATRLSVAAGKVSAPSP